MFEEIVESLFTTYFSFNKHSQVTLGFNDLPFPAITLCNINPMKHSKRHLASDELQSIIEAADPDAIKRLAGEWKPEFHDDADDSDDRLRTGNFLDDMNVTFNFSNPRLDADNVLENLDLDGYSDSWEGEAEKSTFSSVQEDFIEYFNAENANFTLHQSATYGNCYTLSYSKFIARKSGPAKGLELILFLETDDYLHGLTNGKGLQLVVHEQGTLAYPDEQGIAIDAGTHTLIGLRQNEKECSE
ncbi:acid-sensing ion channel 1 [Aplysia californica]|uniref:Acid-sensing ion channel 1 n=1 Tax=Aplysia californica TaxID=6500 RepID=A0ABM0K8H0_APLCA|nr:acid-sensing ion channel 1 [Aplysia californica]